MSSGEIPLNPLLQKISWLIGTWTSKDGTGHFPTIKDFSYHDTLEFRQCGGQPLLAFSGSSRHPEKGMPMHLESGFLRARDGGGGVSFMVAHNFGLTTLEDGTRSEKEITLVSKNVGRMSGAKDPSVLEVKRVWTLLDENTLKCTLWMKTSTCEQLTEHLVATYNKV